MAFKDSIEFAVDEAQEITGVRDRSSDQSQGRRDSVRHALGRLFCTPHYYTLLGYLMLLHEIGLDYTFSAYASEGGNFGLFSSHEMMKRLNAKIYEEAKRLGVKWILGGECGHMWRVIHQYMDTMNGPADFLEPPVSPVTGTRFENARSTRDGSHLRVHRGPDPSRQTQLDPRRNDAGMSLTTTPAILRAPWDCWRSRATS